jgi:uncharacterized protein DUF6232
MTSQSKTSTGDRSPEILHYPGPEIVITSRRIVTTDGVYAVRELTLVQQVREQTHPARTLALFHGGLELGLGAILAVSLGSVAFLGAGLLTTLGFAVATLVDARRSPTWLALQAVHRGRTVTLFSTRDRQTFEQVRRATIRAVEANRPLW